MTFGPPANWPHADHSRMVECAPHHWHVQDMGRGPVILLLHGIGGSTHCWRYLMPLLARTHRVIAVDLPGQGHSRAVRRGRLDLPSVVQDLASLLDHLGARPQVIIGHSSGAALAVVLARQSAGKPRALVLINPVLAAVGGPSAWLAPFMARALTVAPFGALVLSKSLGTGARVRELAASTGSTVDDETVRLATALLSGPNHVRGALAMLAHWSLAEVLAGWPDLTIPTLTLRGARDTVVGPEPATRTKPALARDVTVQAGHLAPEEAPEALHKEIRAFLSTLPGLKTENGPPKRAARSKKLVVPSDH